MLPGAEAAIGNEIESLVPQQIPRFTADMLEKNAEIDRRVVQILQFARIAGRIFLQLGDPIVNGSLSEFDLRQSTLAVMLDDRDEVGLIPVRGACIRTETWVAFTQQHDNLQLFPTTILAELKEEIVKT